MQKNTDTNRKQSNAGMQWGVPGPIAGKAGCAQTVAARWVDGPGLDSSPDVRRLQPGRKAQLYSPIVIIIKTSTGAKTPTAEHHLGCIMNKEWLAESWQGDGSQKQLSKLGSRSLLMANMSQALDGRQCWISRLCQGPLPQQCQALFQGPLFWGSGTPCFSQASKASIYPHKQQIGSVKHLQSPKQTQTNQIPRQNQSTEASAWFLSPH